MGAGVVGVWQAVMVVEWSDGAGMVAVWEAGKVED